MSLTPSDAIRRISAYRVPRPDIPVDLHLAGNEGPPPAPELLTGEPLVEPGDVRNYPDTSPLVDLVVDRLEVDPAQLLMTGGADDALWRICRVMLEPGRAMVLPEPTFLMMRRFAAWAGGSVLSVDWSEGAYPVEAVLEAAADSDEPVGVVAVVSPNNPTGLVATEDQVRRLADALPETAIVVDHAYVEFTDHDCTHLAGEYSNVVVARTLSKAWGMAGLRVGYALGAPEVIEWMRGAGNPYNISGPSVRLAVRRLDEERERVERFIDHVRRERRALGRQLADHGAQVTDSHGNFVFARLEEPLWFQRAMAGMGIGIRAFPGNEGLEDAVRVSCPGDPDIFERVEDAVDTIFDPEAVFLDMDGVIADVRHSYRSAIRETANSFGADITDDDVSHAKAQGDANNDWVLTQRMLADRGIEAEYDEVKARYEALYQGTDDEPGLWERETFIPADDWFERLTARYPVGVVTGRPRRDADRFIEYFDLGTYFEAVVCMEDAPRKPNPDPVELLAEQMGVERAWMVGDTPDDVRAARAAESTDSGRPVRVLPLGIVAPYEEAQTMRPALTKAGAARILTSVDELLELLP